MVALLNIRSNIIDFSGIRKGVLVVYVFASLQCFSLSQRCSTHVLLHKQDRRQHRRDASLILLLLRAGPSVNIAEMHDLFLAIRATKRLNYSEMNNRLNGHTEI